jgi:arylformamidase
MWIDITRPIGASLLVYPGDPPVTLESLSAEGPSVSRICLTTHSGTHVDAPSHLLPTGATIDSIGWDCLSLSAQVLQIRSPAVVSVKEVAPKLSAGVGAVLFRTPNESLSRDVFSPDHVYVEPRLAKLLVQRGVKLVGIDYLSIDPPGSLEAHREFLSGGTLVLEDVDLRGVHDGLYRLLWLPLKVTGGDGAPCRAFLGIEGEGP